MSSRIYISKVPCAPLGRNSLQLLVFGVVCLFATPLLLAQGTQFTYQGRLQVSGAPAGGNYDFRFRLAADPLGNNYVGNPYLTNGVPVNGGLFSATVDFGAGLFTGTNYWLEVDVRTNGAGGYSALTPLQAITPAPYAIMAGGASNLLGLLPAAQLTGSIANSQLPGSPNFSGSVTASAFSGNGAGVSNVDAAALNGLSASGFWKTGGNAGTSAGANFLGTTDNQPLELRVNNQRGVRLEPGAGSSVNVIAGYEGNKVAPGLVGVTISGGGAGNYSGAAHTNRADASLATVSGGGNNFIFSGSAAATLGGGLNNTIQSNASYSSIGGGSDNRIGNGSLNSAIGGGQFNSISSLQSTIGGGYQNVIGGTNVPYYGGIFNFGQFPTIGGGAANYIGSGALGATIGGGVNNVIRSTGPYATIGGGNLNTVTNTGGLDATIGGGFQNVAAGDYATIPGGALNEAGFSSLAAGYRAKATNSGSFAWADFQSADFRSTSNNQFIVRAANGVGINTNRPGATLDVNGSFRVGNGTTVFNNLQAGLAQMSTDSTTVKTNFTFTFPKAFASVPNILVSPRSASDVDDTFAVTVRRVTTTTCTVNVARTDAPAGWGQHVQVTWLAWE